MKTIMIFGGLGFVGTKLAKTAYEAGWKVYIADNRLGAEPYTGIKADIVDITSEEMVKKYVFEKNPDVIVNVAAISDIDKCEENQELALRINTNAAVNIARCCKDVGGKYIFFSSDAVFDGKSNLYYEGSLRNPLNFYGKTKMFAEDQILSSGVKACILRLSLIIGLSSVEGNSFLAALRKKLEKGQNIYVSDEIRTPIFVDILCNCILELAENNFAGVIHIGSTDYIDKFTLAKKAAGYMGLDAELVQPVDLQGMSKRAPRHKNGILSVEKAQSLLKTKLLDTDGELKQIFGGIKD
jgi:dTDP-4-dehydrorhamnose reductase